MFGFVTSLGFSAPYPHVSFSVFIAAYCSPPNYPVNGSVHSLTGTKLGSTLRFSCDQGYRLIGQSSATCTRTAQGTHQWNAPVPLCQGRGPTRAALSLARQVSFHIWVQLRWLSPLQIAAYENINELTSSFISHEWWNWTQDCTKKRFDA